MIEPTGTGALPSTYFAPAERAPASEMLRSVEMVNRDPIVTALLRIFGSLVAVLNEQRQILAVNDGLLRYLGVEDPAGLLGLRPGEALQCVHTHDHPGGCGTSRFCTTCGAAIAIVTSLNSGEPQEAECLVTIRGERETSVELKVRAVVLEVNGMRLLMLLLEDIRDLKRRQALEVVFQHDLNNTLAGLLGSADILQIARSEEYPRLAMSIQALARRLGFEIQTLRVIEDAESGRLHPHIKPVRASRIAEQLQATFLNHPLMDGHDLRVNPPPGNLTQFTDEALLIRILINMVKNALEATPAGGEVRVGCERAGDRVVWSVWNQGQIEELVALRIFQRYFSTKAEPGHGLGTYSMKLIGEHYLQGKVSFSSSAADGTTFRLSLPADPGRGCGV